MCMFSYRNTVSNIALVKGVERFECGACPECLQKKSRKWALRCGMEAKVSSGVMVTLTYDSYKENGSTPYEENPVDPSLCVNKKHCQNFIKRVRKHFPGKNIKYLITAEYGKRTGRAHYHALLFNVVFDDLIKYKKSKRNNIIYKSKTLEKLWTHGICTVDCINLTAKTARYCTKYCAKDAGVDDTFMLFSRGIGEEKLLELFNGVSYWLDGREYSIPREIWQKYIEKKYSLNGYSRYVGIKHLYETEKKIHNIITRLEKQEENTLLKLFDLNYRKIKHLKKERNFRKTSIKNQWLSRLFWYEERIQNYEAKLGDRGRAAKLWRIELQKLENSPVSRARQNVRREIFAFYRDNDPMYQRYIAYWKNKNEVNNVGRASDFERILALPPVKYWSYQQKAIQAKLKQGKKGASFVPPRSNCHGFDPFFAKKLYTEKSFAPLSCHYTANDTKRKLYSAEIKELTRLRRCFMEMTATECEVSPFA